jgi:hypothetical protein
VLPIDNPLSSAATLTAGPASGPFELDPGDLPAQVAQGGSASVGILYDPVAPGPATGTVTTIFDGAAGRTEQTWEVHATGEAVTWAVVTPTLDFGGVDVGDTSDLIATFLNTSTVSPATLTSATVPAGGFSIVGSPFPLDVPPGATRQVTVRYAPTVAAIHDGTLQLGPNDPGGPLSIAILAEGLGTGSEKVTDYGDVYFDGSGFTQVLSVSVPDDAISLYLEAVAPTGLLPAVIHLASLHGPGGKEYEQIDTSVNPPAYPGIYTWIQGWRIFSTQLPNTDKPNIQLVPGGGTYTFSFRRASGLGNYVHVRAIVERRSAGTEEQGVLPLNVYLADGITPTAATAESDTYLQAVLNRVDTILSQQGIRLGDIDYYDITDPGFDQVTSESEFFDLLKTSSQATELRLNLFFVEVALGGGVVGVSAGISGPRLNGTEFSGVMSVYGGWSSSFVGLVAAHEIGHFTGLWHTKEEDGSFDFVDDTEECASGGCGLLMHWEATGGTTVTDGQGHVIRGHPHMDPAPPGGQPLIAKPVILDKLTLSELRAAGPNWCGTCNRLREARKR